MVVQEKLYTVEEFFEIAALPENEDRRLELDEGVIVDMGSSSRLNTVTAIRIAHFLASFVIPNNLGYITGADAGYRLTSGRARRPDVAFISRVHGITLEGVAFPIAPDLAVEVVSPDEDVLKKANEYIRSGARIVWAVYTEEKAVYVIQPANGDELRVQRFDLNATLDGGDVLLGFKLAVRDIFPIS